MTGDVTGAIETFRLHVDDAVLDDLHSRLARTRFPDQIDDTGWDYGVPVDYLRRLVDYWRDEYDCERTKGGELLKTSLSNRRILSGKLVYQQ